MVETVFKSYLEREALDAVSRKLLLEILSDRADATQILQLFPPEKKEKLIDKLMILPR